MNLVLLLIGAWRPRHMNRVELLLLIDTGWSRRDLQVVMLLVNAGRPRHMNLPMVHARCAR